MLNILCIETATTICSVALASDGSILSERKSSEKNAHSAIITLFIDDILKEVGLEYTDIDAIAVSKGPGSYTGLRIGVSTAKGLCYALDVPLISVNTLQSMAKGMADNLINVDSSTLFCPMIDARRMEVYSAIFDNNTREVRETKAEIIEPDSFAEYLTNHKMIFFGDGAPKCRDILTHPNAVFYDDINPSAANMAEIAKEKFKGKQFENVAYFEPFYLKEFIAGIPRVKGLK
jgi:tRNA threonylcarbamoyladenosine biosynthesis protein TsaB